MAALPAALGPSQAPKLVDPRQAVADDEVMIATYNVENLFDTKPEPGSKYTQFTPDGDYHWTEAQLDQKLANLGKVVRSMNGGKGPDLLALTEVQSKAVLARFDAEQLAELGYQSLVHLDGEDKRGIDNAILCKHPLVGEPKLHTLHDPKDPLWGEYTTRGVLEASFDVKGVTLTALVVHLPRDLGGARKAMRMQAATRVRELMDAIEAAHPGRKIVVLGDFNSNPGESELAGPLASADTGLVKKGKAAAYNTIACLADQLARGDGKRVEKLEHIEGVLAAHGDRLGTVRGPKGWAVIDHILVSRGLLSGEGLSWVPGSTAILREPWMLDPKGAPKETFDLGAKVKTRSPSSIGFSDHLPVSTVLRCG